MPAPVKMAVVGAGSIGIRAALEHLAIPDTHDAVTMTAVCDPAPGRAKAAAEKYGVRQSFEDFDECLRKGDFDAVTLGTPIGLHYEQGLKCIRAGKHIHFNKTMTMTAAQAGELISEARARKLKIVASPGEMAKPHFREMRRLIRDGALGQLSWALTGAAFGAYHENESVRKGNDPLSNINPAWYWSKSAGGGPLYDMTVYGLHALTGILGPARRVTAFSGVGIKEREFRGEKHACDAHDNTLITLDFGHALFAFVYGTFAGHILSVWGCPSFFGAKGSIVGWDLNGKPLEFPGREQAAKARLGIAVLLPHVNGKHKEMDEAHVFSDIMQLADLVRNGTPAAGAPEHARHVIEIFDAAYRSAETGQAQELKTTFEQI